MGSLQIQTGIGHLIDVTRASLLHMFQNNVREISSCYLFGLLYTVQNTENNILIQLFYNFFPDF